MSTEQAYVWNAGTWMFCRPKRYKPQKGEAESRDGAYRGGEARSNEEVPVMGME